MGKIGFFGHQIRVSKYMYLPYLRIHNPQLKIYQVTYFLIKTKKTAIQFQGTREQKFF